jgi:hypothetical protein
VKLEVSHLCIFGSPVYVHIPTEKRTKLEPSSEKGIFVGYSEVFKGLQGLHSRTEEDSSQSGMSDLRRVGPLGGLMTEPTVVEDRE